MGILKPDSEELQLQKSVDAARDARRWMETELAAAQKNAADALNASRKAIRDRNISAALEQKQLAADLRVSNLAAELDHARIDLDALEKDLVRCRKTKQWEADTAAGSTGQAWLVLPAQKVGYGVQRTSRVAVLFAGRVESRRPCAAARPGCFGVLNAKQKY